jgi:nucleotide-binding universal stress UspA family protein
LSGNAAAALAWAEQLAKQHAALLVLVHAVGGDSFAAPPFVPLLREHHDEIRARLATQLDRAAERARRDGLKIECELAVGSASGVVAAAVRRRHADLVVAGTRGRTSWNRLLLGSTAARLVRNAGCPVLTIHPTDVGSPRPVRTVLVPTDFSEDAALAADAAIGILGKPDRRLVLLHAYQIPPEATYLPAHIMRDAVSAVEAEARHTIEELAGKVRGTGIAVETVTCEGYAPQVILDQAKSIGADLIAMGTHGRFSIDRLFLGSTAERVLASAPCPVLTVRRDPGE